MEERDKQIELERLRNVHRLILSQLQTMAENRRETRKELDNALLSYWENTYAEFWDEAQLAEMVARERSIAGATYRRFLQLQKMSASPYFGRIDFMETHPNLRTENPDEIYIGIGTLADPTTGCLVIHDWRSPVAGMFYDFERGNAWYSCPEGNIGGNIALKRQFKIVEDRMIYMFDSDLKIDDEILQEILGRSADQKMRTIITSIQREQNRVIRDEGHRYLLVQGPAGSGKTSIALHRAAYLLYHERNSVTAKNILIFSPNRIFNDYISDVLPEMGEENVLQTTFYDYAAVAMSGLPVEPEDWYSQLEYIFTADRDAAYSVRIEAIRYKSSPRFWRIIQGYVQYLTEEAVKTYPPIVFRGVTLFSRDEWQNLFFNDLAYLPLAQRLTQLKKFIQIRLRPLKRRVRQEKEQEIAATGEEVNETTIKARARLAARDILQPLVDEVDRCTEIDPLKLYRRLFEDEATLGRLAANSDRPEKWPEMARQTLAWLDQGRIPYEDAIPLLYLQGTLQGFPIKTEIKHLIIDEAQDYTALQYEILKQIFPRAYWTVLGDRAQSIHPAMTTVDFENAAAILSSNPTRDGNAEIIRLTRSYRSTREIQDFCARILPGQTPSESVNRPGPKPLVISVQSRDAILSRIIREISGCQNEGWRSIAILCKTLKEATLVFADLQRQVDLSLITHETAEFRRGVVVIPSYLAKGLEFDAVLIYNASARCYSREEERHLFYTMCTRALHRLTLLYTGELSPFVATMEPTLYTAMTTSLE